LAVKESGGCEPGADPGLEQAAQEKVQNQVERIPFGPQHQRRKEETSAPVQSGTPTETKASLILILDLRFEILNWRPT
jgi:hypothetical protein